MDNAQPNAFEAAQQLCSESRAAQQTAPRYSAIPCRPCRGAGFTLSGRTRTECRECHGAGATAVLQHGHYEPVTEGEEPEPRGRELADASQLRDRLLSWACALAEAVAQGDQPLSRDSALMLRDELVLHVEALDQHRERSDERELADDLRDDELQELHEHLEVVERERDEAREGNGALKAALAAEHKMRAADAETIAELREQLELSERAHRTTIAEEMERCRKLTAECERHSGRAVAAERALENERAEASHARVEHEAAKVERDEALAAVGQLVIEGTELKLTCAQAGKTIEALNAELLRRTPVRGVA